MEEHSRDQKEAYRVILGKFGRMTEDEIRAILVSAVKEGVLNFTMNQYGKKLYYLK